MNDSPHFDNPLAPGSVLVIIPTYNERDNVVAITKATLAADDRHCAIPGGHRQCAVNIRETASATMACLAVPV